MKNTKCIIPTCNGVLYKVRYPARQEIYSLANTDQQYPHVVIGFDVPIEMDCIEVPLIVSAEGFFKYALGNKRISVLRFYCKHVAGATPSGDGSKDNPWNNFLVALRKLQQFKSLLGNQFVQLVVDGSSDTITITENDILPPPNDYPINYHIIVGSFDGKTFFKIKAECNLRMACITSGIISQCHLNINGGLTSGYMRGDIATTFYRTTVNATSIQQIHRVIECQITADSLYYTGYKEFCIIYDSTIQATRCQLYAEGVMKSHITAQCEHRAFQICYLIDSTCVLSTSSNSQLLIHTLFKSNLTVTGGYFNDVHYMIDSTISIETGSFNAVRLWGGWDEPIFSSLDVEAIISNTSLNFKRTVFGTTDWKAIACCIGVSPSKIAVSNFNCSIKIDDAYDNDIKDVNEYWYCVFPPNNYIPSECKVIKGQMTYNELDCYRY